MSAKKMASFRLSEQSQAELGQLAEMLHTDKTAAIEYAISGAFRTTKTTREATIIDNGGLAKCRIVWDGRIITGSGLAVDDACSDAIYRAGQAGIRDPALIDLVREAKIAGN